MATPVPSLSPALAPDDPRLGAWRAFIHAHARVLRRLDEELQATHDLSIAEYDALLQLVNAPARRLRMSILAERVLLSRSGITRLVDRLVAAGMVERSACVSDARGAEAALTPKGLETLRLASQTHLDGVDRYFVGLLSDEDRAVIEAACEQMLDAVGRAAVTESTCTIGNA